MADTTHTLRQVIEAGGRGDFVRKLLAFYDNPDSLRALYEAYVGADQRNRYRLERACPGIGEVARLFEKMPRLLAYCLEGEFPVLYMLDAVLPDPHAVEV